ncbi:MAG: hypothetical protein R8G66_34180 [Cytophagales bacterium]|nr:hypothetical protein [Cytophagales bacterium]
MDFSSIIALLKTLKTIKSSVGVLISFKDFWQKHAVGSAFDQALSSTLIKVDENYSGRLFGGDLRQVFNKPEIKAQLQEVLFAYGEIDKEELSKEIYFNNLPEDFFEVFMSNYFNELIQREETRKSLAEWASSQDLVSIQEGVFRVEEELQAMKSLLVDLASNKTKLEDLSPISYPNVPKYLERTLVPFLEFTSSNLEYDHVSHQLWKSDSIRLEDLLLEKDRIVILGVGGFGKSVEFKNLAFVLSNQDTKFPIHINLGEYGNESIEDLLRLECEQWLLIPPENIIIIFDALDEVHTSQSDFFIRKLNKFSKLYGSIKIVVSCRNNQYPLDQEGKGPLEGYETYSLAPLSTGVILHYLEGELGKKGEEFYTNLWNRNLLDLIRSPFYLIKITELHIENGFLPEKRSDLFDHLTTKKIESDLEKFKLIGVDLRNYTKKIKKEIYKIAFVCQCLGKGSLDEFEELQEIVLDPEMLQRIQRSFLFNRSDGNKWEFEHNNFREYFSAIFLREMGFDFIKRIATFPPSNKIIKPNWVNTLTFLIGILDGNSDLNKNVIHFLLEYEPELLFRMEKEKLDLSTRLNLAQQIVMKYESRDLWVRSEKFSTHDISLFISGSPDAFEWLKGRLNSKDSKILLHTLEFLEGFEFNSEQKQTVIKKLIVILGENGIDEYFYYKTVKLLLKLEVQSESIIELLHSNEGFGRSQYIRAGLYLFIKSNGLSDKYLSLLIDGASQVKDLGVTRNSKRRRRDVFTNLESEHLIEAFSNIHSRDSLIRLIDWIIQLPRHSDLSDQEGIIEAIVNKCQDYDLKDPLILDSFVKLLIFVERTHIPKLEKKLLDSIAKASLQHKVFRKLFQKSNSHQDDSFWVMSRVAGIDEVKLVYDSYVSNKISDDYVRIFRNTLSGEDKEVREWFHTKINEFSGNKFLYDPPEPSWDEIMNRKRKETIDFLHNKEALVQLARRIFEKFGKEILFKNEMLRRITRKELDSELNENFALDILRGISTEQGVTFDQFVNHIDDSKTWEWIQMTELVSQERSHNVALQPRDIHLLKLWTEKNLADCDFKTALTESGNQISVKRLEVYITFLIRHHEFDVPYHVILDLLYMASSYLLLGIEGDTEDQKVDRPTELLRWISEKCGLEETKEKVLEILSENLAQDVFTNLASFAASQNMIDSLPFILSAIRSDRFRDHQKNNLLDAYFELNGDMEQLTEDIHRFPLYTILHALDLLNDNEYLRLEDLCLTLCETIEDSDKQLELIQRMMNFSFVSSCRELFKWIKRNNDLPVRHGFQSTISANDTLLSKTYKDLTDIYETLIKKNLGDWDFDGRRSYLELILKAGTLSEQPYNYVRMKLHEWMENYDGHHFLYFKIQELDTQYYQTVSPVMTLSDILETIE